MSGAYRKLFRGRSELLVFDEAEQRLRPFSRRYVGIRSIPLRQVVGTHGRGRDFDREFLPRRAELAARRRAVKNAYPDGAFPPIVVNRLGEAYFVVDGHHRVAVARGLGMETIDAEVTELSARWQLTADADACELIHAEQHRIFMEESGLGEVAPGASIRFTQPIGYREMLETVQLHGYGLMRERRRVLAPREIAADWFENVYLDALETFRREGLVPRTTESDLFICVSKRLRELLSARTRTTLVDAARHLLEQERRPAWRRFRPSLAGRLA